VLNATLLAPRPAGTSRVRIGLDVSAQPFLKDHRVGPRAILSTVMSLEAMGEAVLKLRPGSVIRSVNGLAKRRPLFVTDGAPEIIEVEVVAEADDALRCRIVSDPDGSRVPHDEALLHVAAQLPGPRPSAAPLTGRAGPAVAQALIYRLFFHGPSFQIIRSAHLRQGCLIATLDTDLPPLVNAHAPSAVAPRLIELCLQGAGLLELETTGRMMIPRSLDLVMRHSDLNCGSGRPLRAVVRRRLEFAGSAPKDPREPRVDLADPNAPLVFDAAVLDEDDHVHLEVRGYRTAPYDQPVDGAAVAAIAAALQS
jgi:hypothetical protein